MKKIYLIVTAISIVCIYACNNNKQSQNKSATAIENTDSVPDMHTSEMSLDYFGTYEGLLPAASGPGIATTLTINADKTYKLISDYIGEENGVFKDSGTYTIKNDIIYLQLKGNEFNYYKIEEGRLLFLDQDKKIVEGPLAKDYILKQIQK